MGGLKKVLVVDDSKLIRQMYRLVLMRYRDCRLVDAMNGLEAMDALSLESGFDLILLDINMPIMNGLQFMEKIRSDGKYTKIPVIVVTTEGKEDDTMKALKLGAWAYLVKPFKSESLCELIEKLLANEPSPLVQAGMRKLRAV